MSCIRLSAVMMCLLALAAAGGRAAAAEEKPTPAAATVVEIDFDACEPVELRAAIMDVRPERGTLVVAEREIRPVDLEEGGRRVRTAYLGLDGQPEPRGAFRPGQYVRVKGVLHAEGFIAAFEIQRIEKPPVQKAKYKPVEASKKQARQKGAAPSAPR